MKKITWISLLLIIFQISCINHKDRYKPTDLFEEYEAEDGFTVLHVPPVLFKIIFSFSEDTIPESKNLLDKIDVVKFMFFEESDNTIKMSDLILNQNKKVNEYNYSLLTNIAQEKNKISIYVIERDEIIHEVLINIISDKEYISIDVVGKLTKDEVMQVYKSIKTDNIMQFKD